MSFAYFCFSRKKEGLNNAYGRWILNQYSMYYETARLLPRIRQALAHVYHFTCFPLRTIKLCPRLAYTTTPIEINKTLISRYIQIL